MRHCHQQQPHRVKLLALELQAAEVPLPMLQQPLLPQQLPPLTLRGPLLPPLRLQLPHVLQYSPLLHGGQQRRHHQLLPWPSWHPLLLLQKLRRMPPGMQQLQLKTHALLRLKRQQRQLLLQPTLAVSWLLLVPLLGPL